MKTVLKLFLSMSFSGGVLILVLFLGKRFLKDKISRQWQYYIWLAAVLRLLIPFGPEANLLGDVYQAIDRTIARTIAMPQWESAMLAQGSASISSGDDPTPSSISTPAPSGGVPRLSGDGSAPSTGAPASSGDGPASFGSAPSPSGDEPASSVSALASSGDSPISTGDSMQSDGDRAVPAEDLRVAYSLRDIWATLANHAWLIWLGAAMGLLIRKVTIYQSFIRYIRAGSMPVSDLAILDRLSIDARQAGLKKPVELCVNPLVSSPLLIGFIHPCIVLPRADISEMDLQYIVLHELTHYRRGDMLYKWLVQVTVCLHWFNPLVHLMSREITKACEFSCDEAVLIKMGGENAHDYGKTLLDAMENVGRYREKLGLANLNGNKQLLKERISAIMNFKKKSKAIRILTGVLTVCVIFGAAFVGIYPIAAASGQSTGKGQVDGSETRDGAGSESEGETESKSGDGAETEAGSEGGTESGDGGETEDGTGAGDGTRTRAGSKSGSGDGDETKDGAGAGNESGDGNGNAPTAQAGTRVSDQDYVSQAERYYEAGSLPLFQIAFSRLDEENQDKWLDRIYADEQIMFWGAAVDLLDEDGTLIQRYAAKSYEDGNIAYFSALAKHMDGQALEGWLDKALEDGKWSFQSILYDELDWGDEYEKLEDKRMKEWEEAQAAEYQAVGVTMDGKKYYYQGQLVNIFLDIRPDKAFYTLNLNPEGTVNIKIIRDGDNRVTGVAYMTEEEAAELLEGDDDTDGDDAGDEDNDGNEYVKGDKESNGSGGWPKSAVGRTWYPQLIPVDLEEVEDMGVVYLGEYTLSEGDRIWYAVTAETGKGMQIGFAEPDDESLDTTFFSVKNRRQEDGILECAASFTLRSPAQPGTYKLFLRATDGNLGNIRGSISIGYVADTTPLRYDGI